MIRYTVHFTGRVQGVGFRFTVQRIAAGHKAAGFVQNLPDGRVLLVIEGAAADLDGFIAEVARRLARYIEQQTMTATAATGEFGDPDFDAVTVRY